MKSTLGAALAIYFLCTAPTKGYQVWAIAASKDQAKVVFNNAKANCHRLADIGQIPADLLRIIVAARPALTDH